MSVVQIVTVIRPCNASGGHSLHAEDNDTSTRGGAPIILTTSCKERTTEEITRDDECKNLSEMVCLLRRPPKSESWLLPQPPSLQASVGVDGMRLSIPLCISRSDVLKMSERTKDGGNPTPIECRDEMDAIPSKPREDSCLFYASSPNPKVSSHFVLESTYNLAPYRNGTVLEKEASTCEIPLESIFPSSSLGVLESNLDSFTTRYGLSGNSSHNYSSYCGDGSVFRCQKPFRSMFRTISSTGATSSLNPSTRIIQRTSRNRLELGNRYFLEEGSVSESHKHTEFTVSRSSLGSSLPASFNLDNSNKFPQLSSVQMEESVSTRPQSVVSIERTFENISGSHHLPSSLRMPSEHSGDSSNFVSSRLVEDITDKTSTKNVFIPFKQYFRNKCILCGFVATAKGRYTPMTAACHLLTHIPMNKYFSDKKCLLCGFVSNSKSRRDVKRHLLTHVQSMIFKCVTCFRSFKCADHLPKDKLFLHEEIWIMCEQCRYQKQDPHKTPETRPRRLRSHGLPHSDRPKIQNAEPVISESHAQLLSQRPAIIERNCAVSSLEKDYGNLLHLGESAGRPQIQNTQPVILESQGPLLSQIPLLIERSGAKPDAPILKESHGDPLEPWEPLGCNKVRNAQHVLAERHTQLLSQESSSD